MKKYIIKVSGKVLHAQELFQQLLKDIHQLILKGNACLLVHGGGLALTKYCESNNLEARFDTDGRRITSEEDMYAADMILSGLINTNIIRLCTGLGIRAVGLSCVDHGILTGSAVGDTFTGEVDKVDTTLISLLCNQYILPVLCSVSTTPQGKPLNINADDVALHVGLSWDVNHLVFLTDTPGIAVDGNYVASLTSKEIANYIDNKIITEGMVIKTRNALEALQHGISSVFIGNFSQEGDIDKLLNNSMGTKISIC